jgi:hypothetical protein
LGQEVTETVQAPHLQLVLEQSDATGIPGTRITLVVEVRLPPDVLVYAPGTKGYKPIKVAAGPDSPIAVVAGGLPAVENALFARDQGTSAGS